MNDFENILDIANLLETISSAISNGVDGFMAIIFAFVAVAGLFQCFFGYKLMRVCFAICGFAIGALGGLIGVGLAVSEPAPAIIAAVIFGIIGALLLFHIYRLGVFVLNFALVALLVMLFGDFTEKSLIIGLIAGFISGIIAAVMVRVWTILSTGAGGGLTAGIAIGSIIGVAYIGAILGFALVIGGIVFQFATTGKKHASKSSREVIIIHAPPVEAQTVNAAPTAPIAHAAPAAPTAPITYAVPATPTAPITYAVPATPTVHKASKAEKSAAVRDIFKSLCSITKNLVSILAVKLLSLVNSIRHSLKHKRR